MDTVPSWVQLLIQVPLVGVFIWYSLEMAKRSTESQKTFLEALDKRDTAFDLRNKAMIDSMNANQKAICETMNAMREDIINHDKWSEQRIIASEQAVVKALKPTRTTK